MGVNPAAHAINVTPATAAIAAEDFTWMNRP
jgi:hypothetical protein